MIRYKPDPNAPPPPKRKWYTKEERAALEAKRATAKIPGCRKCHTQMTVEGKVPDKVIATCPKCGYSRQICGAYRWRRHALCGNVPMANSNRCRLCGSSPGHPVVTGKASKFRHILYPAMNDPDLTSLRDHIEVNYYRTQEVMMQIKEAVAADDFDGMKMGWKQYEALQEQAVKLLPLEAKREADLGRSLNERQADILRALLVSATIEALKHPDAGLTDEQVTIVRSRLLKSLDSLSQATGVVETGLSAAQSG